MEGRGLARWGRVGSAFDFAPLALAAGAAAAGIAVAERSDVAGAGAPWCWVAAAGGAAAVALWPVATWPRRTAWLLAVLAGFAALHAWRRAEVTGLPGGGAAGFVTLRGEVVSPVRPTVAGGTRAQFEFGERTGGARLLVSVPVPSGRVEGTAEAPARDLLRPRDEIELSGFLSVGASPRNPGEFDRRGYLARGGFAGELSVRDLAAVEVLAPAPPWPSRAEVALACRDWAADAITDGLGDHPEAAAVIRAMVLGLREGVPPEVEDRFRLSGTMHLFAISGLHVAVFASLVWGALKLLGVRRPPAVALLVPAVFFYAFVTGWRPSAVRAAVMLSVVFVGLATDRQPRLLNSLGAAALLVLGWDSAQLFRPGFQLSFVVLLAIALVAKPVEGLFHRWTKPDPFLPRSLLTRVGRWKFALLRAAGASVAVAVAAWLGSALLIWGHFGIVTPVAVVANVFLVPFAFLVLGLAAGGALATAAGAGWAAGVCNQANAAVAGGLLAAAGWFAGLPGAYLLAGAAGAPGVGACRVTVLDLAGGGSQLVQPAGAAPWLVDAGRPFDGPGRVSDALAALGVSRLAGLVLTHHDIDHIGGAPAVARRFGPPQVFAPGHAMRSDAVRELAAGEAGVTPVAGGDSWEFGRHPATLVEVLYPPPEKAPRGVADDNALVLRVTHGPWRVLLLGDSGFEAEAHLLESGADLRADVLVKGSHRGDLSGTDGFMRAVSPAVVVLQRRRAAGDGPAPGAGWAGRVEGRGAVVVDQREAGAVTLTLRPDELVVTPFLDGQPVVVERPAGQ